METESQIILHSEPRWLLQDSEQAISSQRASVASYS
jgi:hypothetical protein